MVVLTRASGGLLFRDRFNRADSNTIGNGWTESTSLGNLQILSNELDHLGGSAATSGILRGFIGLSDVIIHLNVRLSLSSTTSAGVVARTATVTDFFNGYRFIATNIGAGRWSVIRNVVNVQDSAPVGDFVNSITRMVVEDSGSTVTIKGYGLKNPFGLSSTASIDDLTDDLILRNTVIDGTPLTGSFYGAILQSAAEADEFFITSGTTVTMVGMLSGQKMQIDSRSAVVESGGSASISMNALAMPATTVKLLNALNTVIASITPASGVFSGDVYTTDQAAAPPPTTSSVDFFLNSGTFHFAFSSELPETASRKGLLMPSFSSPHITIEPLNFESDLKLQGDMYLVPAGFPVKRGLRIIDAGAFGQLYTGSFIIAQASESIDGLVTRFTSSDAPTGTILALNKFITNRGFVTIDSGGIGPLVRNEDWGGGIFMPDSESVAIFGEKDFLVPSGNFNVSGSAQIVSGTLNVLSGSIYICGPIVRLEISGTSASAFLTNKFYPQPWAHLTESKTPVVDLVTGEPGLPDGTWILVPSASTSTIDELHARVSGTWFTVITGAIDLLDGGTF